MRRWAALAPEYGEEEYDAKFETFLRVAIQEFEHGIDHQALFKKAQVKMTEE